MSKISRNSWLIFSGIVIGFMVGYWLVKWRKRPGWSPEPVRVAPPPPPAAADDLTEIDGIGPAYARALRALGVTTFADLAASDPDALAAKIDRLAAARIRRDDWIGQAKARA